jgi:hypothetical protein
MFGDSIDVDSGRAAAERAISGLLTNVANIQANILSGANVPVNFSIGLDGIGSRSPAPTYSYARLEQLWLRFQQFSESDLEQDKGGKVVEILRQVTEALIWGEQNKNDFFDFFCEKNLLGEFIRVLSLPRAPKTLKMQLLQSLSMLVQNIRTQTSLYYLLGNNQLNKLILAPLDFNDEEILAYYITLLKSLAMRVDGDTVHFFFRQHPQCHFPLYIEATKFFKHKDQMVRATVRTITLQVYPIEDVDMRSFVLHHAAESYFEQLAQHLKDLWLRFATSVASAAEAAGNELEKALEKAKRDNDHQQDFLMYLSDILDLGVTKLNELLTDRLFSEAFVPVLLTGTRTMSTKVQFFLIRLTFETFKSRVLIEPLAAALFYHTPPSVMTPSVPRLSLHYPDTSGPNPYRVRLLEQLQSADDRSVLLAAAVAHGCIRNQRSLPGGFLQRVSLLPQKPLDPFDDAAGQMGWLLRLIIQPLGVCRAQKESFPMDGVDGSAGSIDDLPELLGLLLKALAKHEDWQLDTLRPLSSMLLEWFTEPCVNCNIRCHSVVQETLHASIKQAARYTVEVLEDAQPDDQVLDIVYEEWELQMDSPVDARSPCADPGCLLPSIPVTNINVEGKARRIIRAFFQFRRLLFDLVEQSLEGHSPQTRNRAADEPSPLATKETDSPEALREGVPFEIGSVERFMCSVSAPDGKSVRYLVLHDFWLLLVQPDLSSPGWAMIKTLWPLWQVQSFVDRSDPRILQVGLRAKQGGKRPGGAMPVVRPNSRGTIVEDRPDAFFTLTLEFEDPGRCHEVDVHFRSRRRDTRDQLLLQAIAFAERCHLQPLPKLHGDRKFDARGLSSNSLRPS